MEYARPFSVDLPWPGLVLVTGANGSGKSSLIEAVYTAISGRSLRGTSPWREGEVGHVQITTPDFWAKRRVTKGGSKHLEWGDLGEKIDFTTTTKAQTALSKRVGDVDVWRKCSVFTGDEAELFSLATDRDRKLFLETILGLERFDNASKLCREDLRKESSKLAQLQERLTDLEVRAEERKVQVAEIDSLLGEEQVDPAILEPWYRLADQVEANQKLTDESSAQCREDEARVESEQSQIRRRLTLMGEGRCQTCRQPVPEALIGEEEKILGELEADRERLREEYKRLRAAAAELSRELDRYYIHIQELEDRIEEQDRWGGLAETFRTELRDLTGETLKAKTQLKEVESEVSMLGVVSDILGFRGVRAYLLGQTLRSIAEISNRHQARLFDDPGCAVDILPTKETKTVGVVEAIDLQLRGLAGGQGYRAASKGERRRVDVGLLLALSHVANMARGLPPGTLFLDEMVDALDEQGLLAVGEILGEMAESRTVVVVSHHPVLVESLRPDLHLICRRDGRDGSSVSLNYSR